MAEKAMVEVRFTTFSEHTVLGTIPEDALFEFYTTLRSDEVPCSTCRKISFSINTNKNPGDTKQWVGIHADLRGRPLCVSEKNWKALKKEGASSLWCGCVGNVEGCKCSDQFMQEVMKLIHEKNK